MFEFMQTHDNAVLEMVILQLKLVLLIATVFSILRVFKISAIWRHRLWFLLFLIMLFLPFLNSIIPQWHLPIFRMEAATLPETMESVSTHPGINPGTAATGTTIQQTTSAQQIITQPARALSLSDITPWVLFLIFWMIGILFFQIRYIIGQVRLCTLMKTSTLANDSRTASLRKQMKSKLDLSRRIDILVTPNLFTPMATGFFRHRILLPADYQNWSRAHLEYVLLHETAHIKRFDMLTQFIVHIIVSMFWPNPAVWFAHKQFGIEREHACDDLVVTNSDDPKSYANMLLTFAQKISKLPHVAYAGLSMARTSQLEGRLIAILNNTRSRISKRNLLGTIFISAGLFILILSFSPVAVGDTHTKIDTAHTALVIESLKYALADKDDGVRENAVKTLGKINTTASTELLYTTLQNSNEWEVEVNTAKILLQRGDSRALEKFTRQLLDANADVRKQAAKILCELRHPAAFEPLTKAMNENNADVKEHVVRALSELRIEDAIKPLGVAVKDDDVDIRRIAAWGLGETKNPKALPALYEALNDPDGKVRCNAIESIGDIKNLNSVDHVLPKLTDGEWFVRREAIHVLAELNATQAIPGLINALHDNNKKVREAAAEVLGELGDRRAIVPLSAALHDDSDDVRKEAASALGEFYKEK